MERPRGGVPARTTYLPLPSRERAKHLPSRLHYILNFLRHATAELFFFLSPGANLPPGVHTLHEHYTRLSSIFW